MAAMPLYVVESSFHHIAEPGVKTATGAVGQGGGSEKIYLHVMELDARTVASLAPRVDEHGNKQHDRLARPGDEDWWIAVEGEKVWPGTVRPKVVSRCLLEGGKPVPRPVGDEELAELRRVRALP
jgi:hypothetical protein